MYILHLLYILVIGLSLGVFAKMVMRGDAAGLGWDQTIGVLGSLAGWSLVAMIDFRNYVILYSMAGAVAGALVLLYGVRLLKAGGPPIDEMKNPIPASAAAQQPQTMGQSHIK